MVSNRRLRSVRSGVKRMPEDDAMLTIQPVPQPRPQTAPTGAAPTPPARPVASRLPAPPGAGVPHAATLGDDITLGIGLLGVGALGAAAAASAGAFEGVALAARPAIGFAAKALPKYVDGLRDIGREFGALRKDPEATGSFLARKTADALVDAPGAAIVGGAFSAGAAIAWHVLEAVRAPHDR